MLQHLAKWALFAALWRRASPYLLGTVIAVVMVLTVTAIHAEFLDYVRLRHELQGPESNPMGDYLSLSFVIKWLCYGTIALGYGIYWIRRAKVVSARRQSGRGRRSSGAAQPTVGSAGLTAGGSEKIADESLTEDDAAFDFLRDKRRLRGRAQQVLQRDRETP